MIVTSETATVRLGVFDGCVIYVVEERTTSTTTRKNDIGNNVCLLFDRQIFRRTISIGTLYTVSLLL